MVAKLKSYYQKEQRKKDLVCEKKVETINRLEIRIEELEMKLISRDLKTDKSFASINSPSKD